MAIEYGTRLTPREVEVERAKRFKRIRISATRRTSIDPLTGCWNMRGRYDTHGITPRCATVFNPGPFLKDDGTPDNGPNLLTHGCLALGMVLETDPKSLPQVWWRGLRADCGNAACWNPYHYTFPASIPRELLAKGLEAFAWRTYSLNTYIELGDESYLDSIEQTGSSEKIRSSYESDTREE
jgi:hypothetical protein